jgi:hypothetical protein
MKEATPRPWFIDSKNFDMGNDAGKAFCSIRGMSKEDQATPWHIAEVLASGPNPKQDAALIVKAVNDHEVNEKARITLENLTPGGSEYHKDPERCAVYINRVKHDAVEAHKQVVRLRRTHDRAKALAKIVVKKYEGTFALPYDDADMLDTALALLTDMEG